MRKITMLLVLLAAVCLPARAQLQRPLEIHGVIPTENITSLELNPSMNVLDDAGGVSVNQLTFKAYYAYNPTVNLGVEVPLSRYESPSKSINGLGDTTLALTLTTYHGEALSFGTRLEVVAPTATDDLLGSGKVMFQPSVYGVYIPNEHFFVAFGYRQSWSIAGDGGRSDINVGRVRAVLGYLSSDQWWVLVDPRYVMDYNNAGQAEFAPEAEIGTMVNQGTALYLRGGGHVAGNMQSNDWNVSVGFKVLYL